MEENEKVFSVNTEEIKKETSETVNQVKDAFKNADFKKDSKEATGFFSSFFKNPLEEIKKATSSTDHKYVKIAIIVFIVWISTILMSHVWSMADNYLFGTFGSFSYFFSHLFHNILNIIKALVAPVITIFIFSGLIYGFKKVKNRSFLTIISSVIIAKIPLVMASIFNFFTMFSIHLSKINIAFSGFCNVLSTVLLFFTIKHLSEEDKNDSYFWKFALIIGIFYIVKFILSYVGISL